MKPSLSPKIKLMVSAVRLARKILVILEGQIPADVWADYEAQVERSERRVAFAALTDKTGDA